MSINFNEPVNEATTSMIEELFGVPKVEDRKTFLFDRLDTIWGDKMKRLTNQAQQPVTVEAHGLGDIKTMADGTRYRVTENGWEKLDD